MFKQYPKLQIRSILVDCVFCLFVCLYKARRQCFNLSLFPQEPLTVLSINIYHIDGFIISYLLSGINYISSLQHHGCYSLMLTFLSNTPVGGYSINQKKNKLTKSKKKKKNSIRKLLTKYIPEFKDKTLCSISMDQNQSLESSFIFVKNQV